MNVELLRKVQGAILLNPELLEMGDWHGKKECGTTHCIAGWAQVLSGKEEAYWVAFDDAMDALDLNEEEADRLFYVSTGWPEQFQGPTLDIWKPTPQQAVDRISHFIATEGRE